MGKFLVFGAAGSIGREVVRALRDDGHFVIAAVREHQEKVRDELRGQNVIVDVVDDVANHMAMALYAMQLPAAIGGDLDGVIYAVGHCPSDGIQEAVRLSLSELPLDRYEREVRMHQIGPLNVFQCMLGSIKPGGCYVFLSSAITRLNGQFPDGVHAEYHASVVSAEDWLVEGMRRDPEIMGRNIKVHRLAPAGVDTPFHRGGAGAEARAARHCRVRNCPRPRKQRGRGQADYSVVLL